jgi:hypothetical protein
VGSDRRFIKVADQKPLESALGESGLTIEKLADTKKLDDLKSVKDIQGVVAGKIVSFRISSVNNKERQSKKYQTGTTHKRNPEYDVALAEVRSAEARAEAVRRVAAEAGGGWGGMLAKMAGGAVGGADVGSANAKLAQTPENLEEPVYGTWNYNIVHNTKNAEALISVRLIDTVNASILLEESIPVTVSHSFDTIDNPNPSIGIVEIPAPDSIEETLKNDTIEKITSKFAGQFNAMVSRFALKHVKRAEAFIQQNRRVEAAEEFVNFQFAIRENSNDYKPEKAKAREFLDTIAIADRKLDESPALINPVRSLSTLK